ncbi:MAG TPA: hypothetical protein ENL10_02835 [Candidatus Cloacimonetes bacterium]|nr:hypothetical protein [Candidatus Cloacimonadota bacterium]
MRADESILLTLLYSEKKMIAGRTLLQKTEYFLNEKIGLGIEFTPYYYGPYSTEFADALESLKASGIVKEEIVEYPSFDFNITFEPRKYIYHLTDIGKEITEFLEEKYQDEADQIKQSLSEMRDLGMAHDYKNLSIAAKMHHILKLEEKSMTSDEILDEAKALGWDISEDEAETAITFLEELNLITLHGLEAAGAS